LAPNRSRDEGCQRLALNNDELRVSSIQRLNGAVTTSRFTVTDLTLPGLKLIERRHLGDARGFLSRLFCDKELGAAGWSKPVAQINHSYTARRGTVRGMHFQYAPHSEMKLVSCIRGEVFDIAVDVRAGSETLLRWQGERLSADNRRALLIPEGFAHGFQALTDDVELIYCTSAAYMAEAEAGLNAKDPMLAISWPLQIAELSARDAQHPMIDRRFVGVRI
jgi:dTDP-4-dehydrorhamnose 3,5-epimerase